jgi:hypothetical protein
MPTRRLITAHHARTQLRKSPGSGRTRCSPLPRPAWRWIRGEKRWLCSETGFRCRGLTANLHTSSSSRELCAQPCFAGIASLPRASQRASRRGCRSNRTCRLWCVPISQRHMASTRRLRRRRRPLAGFWDSLRGGAGAARAGALPGRARQGRGSTRAPERGPRNLRASRRQAGTRGDRPALGRARECLSALSEHQPRDQRRSLLLRGGAGVPAGVPASRGKAYGSRLSLTIRQGML